MTSVLVAVPEARARGLADELEMEGITVVSVVPPNRVLPLPEGVDAAIVVATRAVLTSELVAECDRAGVRIIPLGDSDSRLLGRYGLTTALPADANGWEVAAALTADIPRITGHEASPPHRVTVVWGPSGAPGRSTIAIQLAVELCRTGRRAALVDADTVAPSLALLLGLSDDAPGIAAACRRAELGALDSAELTRLATILATSAGEIEVLGGINRPGRWPELGASRLQTTLRACRSWAEETVVDVASAFDADDEATYDLAGPRRHAATVAALQEADAIIAVASADPLGISRFVREHAELRRLTAPTPIRVVVNRVRPGPLGIDARGQIRRTLERFAGITDIAFLPFDQRAADSALLHARPMADLTPRSTLIAGVRRIAETYSSATSHTSTGGSSRGSSRGARRLLRAHEARGA
ncbi:hypothetical protein LJR186_001409 [Microbacterium foliorum]|uniref:AAA family ATPase n=1 Tax=Microbacterium sp. MEJ108Y TaxID=1587523 RepID=UPI000697E91C|nr:P-loop NTPase [Microbacterium sp. MEJ108Y]